jgi:hypothetical protein
MFLDVPYDINHWALKLLKCVVEFLCFGEIRISKLLCIRDYVNADKRYRFLA